MPDAPLATVLINNFNYGRFLRRAIESALAQNGPNVEVLVVDDGSTDDSRAIIASFGRRVVPVLKPNGGQASAFNAGFRAARGDWVFFLDSDDFFLPQKIERVLAHARQFPAAGLIAHNLRYCDEVEHPVAFAAPRITAVEFTDHRAVAATGRIFVWIPATSALALRRDLLERLLPMPEDIRITADDYLKVATLVLSPVLLIPEELAVQRLHGENLYTHREESAATRARDAVARAAVWFHLRRNFACLSRLAWKQYGRAACDLRWSSAPESKSAWAEIQTRYSVIEPSAKCWFYVVDACARQWLRRNRAAVCNRLFGRTSP